MHTLTLSDIDTYVSHKADDDFLGLASSPFFSLHCQVLNQKYPLYSWKVEQDRAEGLLLDVELFFKFDTPLSITIPLDQETAAALRLFDSLAVETKREWERVARPALVEGGIPA